MAHTKQFGRTPIYGRILAVLLLLSVFSGCTRVDNWGLTARGDVNIEEGELQTSDVIRFGDDNLVEGDAEDELVFHQSSLSFDAEKLYQDDAKRSEFANITPIVLRDTISVAGMNYEMMIEKIDFFEDARGSGRYGIAVVYTVKNTSGNTIFFNGTLENVVSFAMFGPNDVSLLSHYTLKTDPPQSLEYDLRIAYPEELYTPAMSTMELEAGQSVRMYRTYDYAGPGTYHLYVSTDIRKNIRKESAELSFEVV